MIVLTGGAGFIGSCFLEKLNSKGLKDILVVDRLGSSEKWKNLLGKQFLDFITKDKFRTMIQSGKLKYKIDTVFHFGACTKTTEKDIDYLFDNNLSYTIDLAEFVNNHHLRFIYASSAATYGSGNHSYSDEEFLNLKPLNGYGLSKHLFDLWVINNKLDKTYTGIKFFNVFGPNEYHKEDMASMVYKAYLQIKKNHKVSLFKSNSDEYKNGEQKRDFIYIKDVVNVIWKIYQNKNVAGIYNLGSGEARTWNDLANSVFNAMNSKPIINYIDMPENLVKQYQNFTQADTAKLVKSGCSIDFMSLEDSINDYVKNYLETESYL